ncbi:MAG: SLBB domain-containing protein [Flavobacterium sp.]|nr:SLBB domain-containing protein [Pedobacter sp.]
MNIKRILLLLCLLSGIFYSSSSKSQTINPQNLSNVRVDELSDDQIRAFLRQVESTGLSESQLEQVAQARGMRPEEIQKLRERVEKIKKQDALKEKPDADKKNRINDPKTGRKLNTEQDTTDSVQEDPETEAEKALIELRSKIFGASLFKNSNLSFEPNLRLATPGNYMIGPDDEIRIDITGDNEANYELTVSPEGTIRIEYAGILSVSGLTVEQATQKIRSRLASTYPGIRNGRTQVTIGIGNIRSIKVTLLGEVVKPGSYTLPSLATAFNALYASGGPTENGSFREIEIIRNNRVVGKLDVYEFLLKGFQTNNIRLQDQDVIRIPTYRVRVEFTGEVKRPAIFEAIAGETLQDVINFAGGFNTQAYSARIKVLQNTDRERRITDVFASEFNVYKPKNGDKYFAEPILDRFENRVTIEGAVFRPGDYELEKTLTLASLIKKAEGVTDEAFLSRGYITRLKADNTSQLISFDLDKILAGTATDIQLQREDVITISSIFDLRDEYKVSIEGEVREPGTFDFAEGMSLEDLIIQSGGFQEGASPQRIEISRRVTNSNVLSTAAVTAQVFQVNVDKNLQLLGEKFVLQPFDMVSVRSETGYEVQRQVRIEGEVLYPGTYTVVRKNERISDLVSRAGGLTALAYPKGASLKRPGAAPIQTTQKNNFDTKADDLERFKTFQRLQGVLTDSTDNIKDQEAIKNVYVGISLDKILAKPGSDFDLTLEEGDTIRVPKQLQTIKVSGEVLSPNSIIYNNGRGFKRYISGAGGFSERSLKKRSYIVYANGSVRSTRKVLLFFNDYPKVQPGAEIFVPKKEKKNASSLAGLVGISTGLASLAAVVLTLFR